MRRLMLLATILLILPSLASAEPWWNSSWTYRKQINITNNNATVVLEQNYTINITANFTQLILDNKMNATGNDTRIVWYNGTSNIELDRINTTPFYSNGSSTTLWFKLQRNISGGGWDANYSLYYGNPSAGSPPQNGSNVYVFFDDFESYADTAAMLNTWAAINTASLDTTKSASGGTKSGKGTNLYGSLRLDFNKFISPYPTKVTVEWSLWGGTSAPHFTIFIRNQDSNDVSRIYANYPTSGKWGYEPGTVNSGVTYTASTWEKVKMVVDCTEVNEQREATSNSGTIYTNVNSYAAAGCTTTKDMVFENRYAGTDSWVDDVKIRKYLSPEPSASLGSEEDAKPPQITITSPTNQTYTTNIVWFNVTLNESGSVVLAQYAGINHTLTNTTGKWWHQNTSMSDGSYFVKFYANDTTGSMNTTNVTFTIDTIPPTITIQSPSNTTYATASIWFNITLNEAGSWCGRSLDSASNITLSNTTGNWNNLMTVSDGSHNVRFFCNDTAGNMNSTTQYFSVNTTPSLNISIKPSKSWWNDVINASGAILASGQSLSDITVTVELNNKIQCTDQTDANGLWTCTFNAPNEVSSYMVKANITLSGNATSATTTLKVAPSWGYVFSGVANRFAHQMPILIQEPSGRIHWVWVTVVAGIA